MNNLLLDIIDSWEEAANITEQDYVNEEDGLIYCGKCHTPKQHRFTEEQWQLVSLGNPEFPRVTCQKCDCMVAEDKRRKELEDLAELERKRDLCFAEPRLKACRFQNDRGVGDREAMRKARIYADKFRQALENNIGLLFWGDVGAGKSYLAACIANSALEQGYSCLMTSFPRIIDGAWDADKHKTEYFDSFAQYDLLVIDDFGTERQTGYVNETVTKVIEYRYNSGKPIILTTNLTMTQLTGTDVSEKSKPSMADKRVYDRLLGMTKQILVQSPKGSLRGGQAVETAKKSMEIFGF